MERTIINSIPDRLSSGIITRTEAVQAILEVLYASPAKYRLTTMNADERDDFIVVLTEKLYTLLDHYRSELSSFETYLSQYVINNTKIWKRDRARQRIENYCLGTLSVEMHDNFSEQYEKNESSLHPENIALQDTSYTVHRTVILKNGMNGIRCREAALKKIALIVALKSCYFISDEDIREISRYSGYDMEQLFHSVYILRASIQDKAEKRKKMIFRRNKAYFFHTKYKILLNNPVSSSAQFYRTLQSKYLYHTKAWKTGNSFLKYGHYKICPTNKDIARQIGICERQVCSYLKKAQLLLGKTE